MSSHLDALVIRRRLGRERWGVPVPFGPDGWRLDSKDGTSRILVTVADDGEDGVQYVHASISHVGTIPTYEDLKALHDAVWKGQGWAYQVFAPVTDHVNIHATALHLWGRLDGAPLLPNWGRFGTI